MAEDSHYFITINTKLLPLTCDEYNDWSCKLFTACNALFKDRVLRWLHYDDSEGKAAVSRVDTEFSVLQDREHGLVSRCVVSLAHEKGLKV